MAKEKKASVIYEGNASQLVYAFPFDYLRKKFVKVEDIYTNITELTIGVDYTVEDKQVRLVKGIPLGHSVKIYRETPTVPLVEWQDASVLRSADMTLQELQLLHIQEEYNDHLNEELGVGESFAEQAKKAAEEAKNYKDIAIAGQLQADWNEEDIKAKSFVKNKPNINILIKTYDSVLDMKKDVSISEGMTIQTKGYYTVNDGGAGMYTIRKKQDSDVEENGCIKFLSNSMIAELIVANKTIYPEQLGAYGDGIHDDTNAIKSALKIGQKVVLTKDYYCTDLTLPQNIELVIDGKLNLNGTITINDSKISIRGNGTIKVNSSVAFLLYGTKEKACRNVRIKDLKIIGNQQNTCIAITNADDDKGAVVYVYIDCDIINFMYGVHSYSRYTNSSWFTSLAISGLIENCNRAVHFEWGGTGSYIKSIIQPCVDNPKSDDNPLVLLTSNCILDSMIWDIDSANNKKAIKITGRYNKINCPINSKYIDISGQAHNGIGYVTPYTEDAFLNVSSVCNNGNNSFPLHMSYDNSNDIGIMAGSNMVGLSVTPTTELQKVKHLLSGFSTQWYVPVTEDTQIILTFDFPQNVALRELFIAGEQMPDSVKFEYKDANGDFIALKTCKKDTDYLNISGQNNYAFWQFSYSNPSDYYTKFAYGVRMTLKANKPFFINRIYIGVSNVLFVNKNGDDIIANTLLLKSEDNYYALTVNKDGTLVANKKNSEANNHV